VPDVLLAAGELLGAVVALTGDEAWPKHSARSIDLTIWRRR
jgi:hypothetical protein